MMSKKKVVAQLPGTARTGDVLKRYALELEALAPIADIHEVRGQTEEEFIEARGIRMPLSQHGACVLLKTLFLNWISALRSVWVVSGLIWLMWRPQPRQAS